MSEELFPKIGARVRALRKELGISQEGLAERAHTSPVYLSRIESGKQKPSVQTLNRLARAMDIPLYAFFMWGAEQKLFQLASKINELAKNNVHMQRQEWQQVLTGIQQAILREIGAELGITSELHSPSTGYSLAAENYKEYTR